MKKIGTTKIDFLGIRKVTFTISAILVLIGLVAVVSIPMGKARMGIDFAGGVSVQFRFSKPVSIEKVRKILAENDFKDANLQQFAEPDMLLVRLKNERGNLRDISNALGKIFNKEMPGNSFQIESSTEIGPTVGNKLQTDALKAIAIALLGILFYVAWRFEFRFGVAAVIATFHDVIVVLGFLYLMDKEITLLIVTALLTLAGYSITDSVVVFDRIRENLSSQKKEGFIPLVNRSINEVLSRTVVTSFTTLLVLAALVFLGGRVIHDFALTLFLGVIVGTYSSIFIASPILLFWKGKSGHAPQKKAALKKGL
ncbi:MAG: protein translocase subunit SecF [Thermodesulfobacteriota bacterium]|nr:MAG: protein translocase subunit SecF [Thermodesulfobacteriota bacterium]